jgi:hypothetical protein
MAADDFRTLPQQLSSCKAAVKHARIKRSLAKTDADWRKWDTELSVAEGELEAVQAKMGVAFAEVG